MLSFPASDDEPLANFQRALGHLIEEALVDKAKAVRMSEHVALCEFKPGTPPNLHAYVEEQVRRAVASERPSSTATPATRASTWAYA